MNLFVYGTLLDPEIFYRITGVQPKAVAGVLADHERRLVREEVFPAIIAQSGATVSGLVYADLSPFVMDLLDRYEGELYRRREVLVRLADHTTVRAETYVIADWAAHLLTQEAWSLEEFRKKDKKRYLESI
ncbi:MAG: gamma-glutamylcyclotransferase [Desulfobulbaceae bacterium]|nr:gamma-glutamylcyclotransferase [Desulfobulbaceae bacterium]